MWLAGGVARWEGGGARSSARRGPVAVGVVMAACVGRGLFEGASVGIRLGLLPAVPATRTEAERPGPAHYLMPPRAADAQGRRARCGGRYSVSWFIVLLRVLCGTAAVSASHPSV